jgi:putative membrane protein
MKKILYFIIFLIVLVLAISFAGKNPQPVEVAYYLDLHWKGPLSVLVFCTLAIGAVLGTLLTLSWVWRAKRQGAAARREVKRMEHEISSMRTQPGRELAK